MLTAVKQIKTKPTILGVLFVLLATVGLSLKAILIKLIYLTAPGIDAISILALRFVFALPFFLLLLYATQKHNKKTKFVRQDLFTFIILGMAGFYVSAILDFSALAYIPAGLERLILFLYPTFVVLLSFYFRPEEISRQVIMALIICYLGVMVVFFDQVPNMTPDMMYGSGLVLAAAVVFAIYTVASVKPIQRHGSIRFTAYAMIGSTLITFLHVFYAHGLSFFVQSLTVYGLILVMAIFSTFLPLIFMAEGVNRLGASRVSIISTSGPIITITLAVILLDEIFGFYQAIGGIMIVSGVIFVARGKRR